MPISESIRSQALIVGAAVLLTACGQQSREQEQARAAETRALAAAPHLFCAAGPGELTAACTAERTATGAGTVITIRHPDGHFRRLLIKADNSITAADGAEPARVTREADGVVVAIGPDRYRLPTVR